METGLAYARQDGAIVCSCRFCLFCCCRCWAILDGRFRRRTQAQRRLSDDAVPVFFLFSFLLYPLLGIVVDFERNRGLKAEPVGTQGVTSETSWTTAEALAAVAAAAAVKRSEQPADCGSVRLSVSSGHGWGFRSGNRRSGTEVAPLLRFGGWCFRKRGMRTDHGRTTQK